MESDATTTNTCNFCSLNEPLITLIKPFLASYTEIFFSSSVSTLSQINMAQASIVKKRIEVGLWGGHGGTAWDDGSYDGIREITVMYGRCIDSIRVVYDKNGKPFAAEKHGGNGGDKTGEVKLQFPNEYLTGVSGYYGHHRGCIVIRSLAFTSNRRTLGAFGVEEGTPFSLPMEGGRIAGFKGRSGWYIDSIGCYIARVQAPNAYQKVLKKLTSTVSGDQNRYRSSKSAA